MAFARNALPLRHLCIFWVLLSAVVASKQASATLDLSTLDVSGGRVVEQLLHLATFSDDPNPAVTRILFTGESFREHVARETPHTASYALFLTAATTAGARPPSSHPTQHSPSISAQSLT